MRRVFCQIPSFYSSQHSNVFFLFSIYIYAQVPFSTKPTTVHLTACSLPSCLFVPQIDLKHYRSCSIVEWQTQLQANISGSSVPIFTIIPMCDCRIFTKKITFGTHGFPQNVDVLHRTEVVTCCLTESDGQDKQAFSNGERRNSHFL